MKKIRPPVKWHGGKHYLAPWIIEHFPEGYESMTYVEPFGGAASVLLNKEPSLVEVYNDIDKGLYRLFWAIRHFPDELRCVLSATPYSEEGFHAIKDATLTDEVHGAADFYVKCRQSFGGQGVSFSTTKHRVRRGMADVVSGWLSSIDENLPLVIERLRTVQILNRDALKVIQDWDSPDTLFYLDPPYMPETRESKDVYVHEMTSSQHVDLIALLETLKGEFVLSGYNNPFYASRGRHNSWRCFMKEISNHAAGGKMKRTMTECLWTKYR